MKNLVVIGSLALAAFTGPASAATILITYEGTVSSGTDATGLFGMAGSDLTGLSYTAAYTLTYPTAGAREQSLPTIRSYWGGEGYAGNPATPLSGSFMINGTTIDVAGQFYGLVQKLNRHGGTTDRLYSGVFDRYNLGGVQIDNSLSSGLGSSVADFLSTTNFEQELVYDFQPGDHSNGAFRFRSNDLDQQTVLQDAGGSLHADRLTVRLAGAVPEPATWAFMIFGFGVIGAAMRRRKKQSAKIAFG